MLAVRRATCMAHHTPAAIVRDGLRLVEFLRHKSYNLTLMLIENSIGAKMQHNISFFNFPDRKRKQS